MGIHGVGTTTWTDAGLKANWDYAQTPTVTKVITVFNAYETFDVTSDVQGWAAGSSNFGWLVKNQLEATASADLVVFRPRELGPGFEPLLVIEMAPAVSVRTNAFVADTYIESNTPTANHGAGPETLVGLFSAQGTVRALYKPALALDPKQKVVSAMFRLRQGWQHGTNDTVNLYRMLVNWSEMHATWQSNGLGSAWGAPGLQAGVDYVATPTVSQRMPPTYPEYVYIDVKSDLSAWAAGVPNYGWFVKNQNESAGGNLDLVQFRTRNFAFKDGGPMLVVEQAPITGTVLIVY